MTIVYFVRHAQPEHAWEDDRTRPLTEEGKRDASVVLDFLKDKEIDVFYSSPYKRSIDTIAETDTNWQDRPLDEQKIKSMTVDTFGVEYPEPEKC